MAGGIRMGQDICVVDCRKNKGLENDYFTLNVWGKPVFSYIVEECLEAGCFHSIYIITDSLYLKSVAWDIFGDRVILANKLPDQNKWVEEKGKGRYFIVHGCALMLKKETIISVLNRGGGTIYSAKRWKEYPLYPDDLKAVANERKTNVFVLTDTIGQAAWQGEKYLLGSSESLVVEDNNDFELALILKKKEQSAAVLQDSIQGRIQEKQQILKGGMENSVCLIGHSQFDDWDVKKLYGMTVRNCGIRGISSFQYRKLILEAGMLHCGSNAFVIMQGTNDIVSDYTVGQIAGSIRDIVFFVRGHNPDAPIFIVPCLHVNGRGDRSNQKIDECNAALYKLIRGDNMFWVDMEALDDDFGNLKREYTRDGLHLSREGYALFGKLLEGSMGKFFS